MEVTDSLELINATMSEAKLGRLLEIVCKGAGWTYYHTWRSDHSTAGFPDYVLLRPPRVIFAELKREKGKATAAQQRWLDGLLECGQEAYLWRPSDSEEILRTLGIEDYQPYQ